MGSEVVEIHCVEGQLNGCHLVKAEGDVVVLSLPFYTTGVG